MQTLVTLNLVAPSLVGSGMVFAADIIVTGEDQTWSIRTTKGEILEVSGRNRGGDIGLTVTLDDIKWTVNIGETSGGNEFDSIKLGIYTLHFMRQTYQPAAIISSNHSAHEEISLPTGEPVFENEERPQTPFCDTTEFMGIGEYTVNLPDLLREVFEENGFLCEQPPEKMYYVVDGLRIVCALLHFNVNGSPDYYYFSTCTTLNLMRHDDVARFMAFEYQYAQHHDPYESYRIGLRDWLKYEFPVIKSFDQGAPKDPVTHMRRHDKDIYIGELNNMGDTRAPSLFDDEGVIQYFSSALKSMDYALVKVFVRRDELGNVDGDVRVNGADFPAGSDFVKQFVETRMVGKFMYKQYAAIC